MTTLRWLHLTDLHIGQKEIAQGYWSGTRKALLADLERTTAACGPWDVVLFTGDLVYSGEKAQYTALDHELAKIWALFARVHPDAPPPILLAVPGNHDLARPEATDPVAEQLLANSAGREALWSGKKTQLDPVCGWFKEYSAWWETSTLKPSTGLASGLLPGDFTFTLEKEGLRFGFAGMNIAFLHVFDNVKEKLWLDARQIHAACSKDLHGWAEGHHFAFLLTHHPPSWLATEAGDQFKEMIAPCFTAHFCGHLHDARLEETRVGGGEAREIWQGASLFGMEKVEGGKVDRRHGYTAGWLAVGEDGSAESTFWPRQGVRRQDGTWAFTADTRYVLQQDLLATAAKETRPKRALPRGVAVAEAGGPELSAAPPSWREALLGSPLWPSGGDAGALARAKQVAEGIVAACWEEEQMAARALPEDVWRDEDLPRRTLARLAALVPPNALGAEEAALVLAAPFVREGLFAAGARWMAQELKQEDRLSLAHKLQEEMCAARPELARRMENPSLAEADSAAIDHWLRTRALRQCPQLWEKSPKLPHARSLIASIEHAAKGAKWMLPDRLVQLARHVGVSPEVFQAEETMDREPVIEPGGVRLRVSALARLLCAAGAWALDLRQAEDLVADHVGREGFVPGMAREAIRSARWVTGKDAKDVHRLVQRCSDPVVDFVLRNDLVKRADHILRRLGQDRDHNGALSCGLLGQLPAQLRADIEIEKERDGRLRYQVPHVRFQLDHGQVRELLMGEQLYGDPTLAIRELYQNALDACRYRKARMEYLGSLFGAYEGKIVFRQDVDESGRAYIECEDNGVGMTGGILEHVFAVAGRRFKDTPEYLEERARWDALPNKIELLQNSRFGIGVLSYFMLADEVKVWTRRFKPEGKLGEALTVHISGASGLFRLEEGLTDVMGEGGTRVRLYLRKTTYEINGRETEISCRETLGKLLWVAEFMTSIEEEGEEPLCWEPGALSPGGRARSRSRFLPTENPDIWWSASTLWLGRHAMGDEGDTPLLVDGIATETMITNALVNLRGPRCGRLSVDRKQVLVWDRRWLDEALTSSLSHLPGWEGLSMMFLWALARNNSLLATQLTRTLCERDLAIPIATPHNSEFQSIHGRKVSVQALGIVPEDEVVLAGYDSGRENLLAAWRAVTWIKLGNQIRSKKWHSAEHINKMPMLPFGDHDADILGVIELPRKAYWPTSREHNLGYYYQLWRSHLVLHKSDVLAAALTQQRSVSEVVDRVRVYEFLGFEVDPDAASDRGLDSLCKTGHDLLPLLKLMRHRYRSRSSIDLSPIDIMTISYHLHIMPSETRSLLMRLAPAGIHVDGDPALLDGVRLDPADASLFTYMVEAQQPQLSGKISLVDLLAASQIFNIPVKLLPQRLRRLEPFGLFLSPNIDLTRLSDRDLTLLSHGEHGYLPWTGSQAGIAHIAQLGTTHNIALSEALQTLRGLAWTGLALPAITPEDLDALEHEESGFREIVSEWYGSEVKASEIAAAATHLSLVSIARIASRLGLLPGPLRSAFEALDPDVERADHDETIFSAFENSPGRDPATRFRRGRALARFHIWEPPDADLDAAIARLRPVIDHIVSEPNP